MSQLRDVARLGDIEPGTGRIIDVDGRLIALFNDGGRFYALDNTCTHRGGPLGDGRVAEGRVTCPWHGAQFDIATGNVAGPPARQPVTAYRVVVQGEQIKLEV